MVLHGMVVTPVTPPSTAHADTPGKHRRTGLFALQYCNRSKAMEGSTPLARATPLHTRYRDAVDKSTF